MQVLINGWYHRITVANEVVYNGISIPIVRDIYCNFWVVLDGELYQLTTFKQDGQLIEFTQSMPEFITKAPVYTSQKSVGFELYELDQYWSLDRKEFYMLITYRVKDTNS